MWQAFAKVQPKYFVDALLVTQKEFKKGKFDVRIACFEKISLCILLVGYDGFSNCVRKSKRYARL